MPSCHENVTKAFRVCVCVSVCKCFEGGLNREMVVGTTRDSGGALVKLRIL